MPNWKILRLRGCKEMTNPNLWKWMFKVHCLLLLLQYIHCRIDHDHIRKTLKSGLKAKNNVFYCKHHCLFCFSCTCKQQLLSYKHPTCIPMLSRQRNKASWTLLIKTIMSARRRTMYVLKLPVGNSYLCSETTCLITTWDFETRL